MTKKYINANLLRKELQKPKAELKVGNYYLDNSEQAVGYENALNDFELLIDSLQQEQPEVNLEEELAEWMKYGPHTNYPWCTIPDAIKITAEHFYELGLNAGKK